MIIRLILLALLASSAWGQITKEISILPGGRIIVKQAGGAIVLRLDTELSVFVPGTTTRGLIANSTGLYLTHNVSGTQTAYFAPDSGSGTGASLQLNTSAGAWKFRVLSGNSDAPDSLNGYRVNGSSVIDATAAGTIGISGGGFNTTTGGYFTNSVQRISNLGDGAFRNLSFTGTGPYTFTNGVSLSGTTVSGSYAAGSGISISGATISTAAPTSIFLTSPITGSLSSNLLSLACGTCVTTSTLGSLGNSLIPTTDNAISVGSSSRRFGEGRFVTAYTGAGNLIAGDGILQMRHRSSGIQTVTIYGDNGFGTGAGFSFTKAGGGAKFRLDQSDSDAPDSVNGYKINGSFPASSGSCGAGEAVKSWNFSLATGTVSFTCGTP